MVRENGQKHVTKVAVYGPEEDEEDEEDHFHGLFYRGVWQLVKVSLVCCERT